MGYAVRAFYAENDNGWEFHPENMMVFGETVVEDEETANKLFALLYVKMVAKYGENEDWVDDSVCCYDYWDRKDQNESVGVAWYAKGHMEIALCCFEYDSWKERCPEVYLTPCTASESVERILSMI